jgi:hypothetical protein
LSFVTQILATITEIEVDEAKMDAEFMRKKKGTDWPDLDDDAL